MKNILLVLLLAFGFHNSSFAELNVTQVKGNKVLVNFDDQELQPNGAYEISDENFETVAKVKALKIQKQKGLLQLLSGKLVVGKSYSIQKMNAQSVEQESKTDVFTSNSQEPEVTNNLKKSFSVQVYMFLAQWSSRIRTQPQSQLRERRGFEWVHNILLMRSFQS
jgi:hypothetical protein